jgi:cell wall-associated NlpC family hydrolase
MKGSFLLFTILILSSLSCQPSVRFSSKSAPAAGQDYTRSDISARMDAFIREWLHTPYKYGGMGKDGIDCSGLAVKFISYSYGVQIPRQARDQYKQGEKVSRYHLQPGDLVFFAEYHTYDIGHVGIYLGDSKFIHATESEGVIVSVLDDEYYTKKYAGACRYR